MVQSVTVSFGRFVAPLSKGGGKRAAVLRTSPFGMVRLFPEVG